MKLTCKRTNVRSHVTLMASAEGRHYITTNNEIRLQTQNNNTNNNDNNKRKKNSLILGFFSVPGMSLILGISVTSTIANFLSLRAAQSVFLSGDTFL